MEDLQENEAEIEENSQEKAQEGDKNQLTFSKRSLSNLSMKNSNSNTTFKPRDSNEINPNLQANNHTQSNINKLSYKRSESLQHNNLTMSNQSNPMLNKKSPSHGYSNLLEDLKSFFL